MTPRQALKRIIAATRALDAAGNAGVDVTAARHALGAAQGDYDTAVRELAARSPTFRKQLAAHAQSGSGLFNPQ